MVSNESKNPRVVSQFRIPRDLHEWLKAEALAHNRSVNGQLVHIVQSAKNGGAK